VKIVFLVRKHKLNAESGSFDTSHPKAELIYYKKPTKSLLNFFFALIRKNNHAN
jgi:hypothetical protein